MKLINSIETFPSGTFVATIGFFDGVHLGHRFLLEKLKAEAKKLEKKTLVISFDKHPKTIIPSDYIPSLLTNNEEKIALFDTIGIDACILLPFNKEMANLTAYEFLQQIIVNKLGVHTLFIGYNHRFGRNREEGITEYIKYGKELGLTIIESSSYEFDNNHISSSEIRRLIENGDVAKAKQFLSYAYCLEGIVVTGNQLGRKIGFPTANLAISDKSKIIPGHGVYAVQVITNGKSYRGMLNIGNRPTINFDEKDNIEVHIIDFNENIYDEKICVKFLTKIRDEVKFNSVDDLILQIGKDKEFVTQLTDKKFMP